MAVVSGADLRSGRGAAALRALRRGIAGDSRLGGDARVELNPAGPVARVIVRLRHHRKVAAPVHDNVYEVNTGDELAPAWGVRWLDAQGNIIDHRAKTSP